MRIIQSSHGISIDQISHTKETILEQWFPDASERVNFYPNPFKSDITFDLALAYTLPVTPAELRHLEERYLVKSSAHIEKLLNIIKYTCPDIMYAVNYLSSYVSNPYVPALQVIKHLIFYLPGFPRRPIMYSYGLDGTTTHELRE